MKKYVENNLVTEELIKKYLLEEKGHKESQVNKNIDKFNQFINYLFYVTIFKKSNSDYVTLDTEYMIEQLGTLKLIKIKCKFHRYISECLCKLGLIENKIYNTESIVRKSEYRFTYKAYKEGFNFLKDCFFIGNKELKLDIWKGEIEYQTPLIEQTKKQLNKLTINKSDVFLKIKNNIKQQKRYINYTYTLRNIVCEDFTIIRHDNKGRMFNFFTMTPKLIREEYLLLNKPLIELDINNCVPMLILEFLNLDNIDKEELNDYINSFEKKSLHKEISTFFNINLDSTKKKIIRYVYFDREKRNNKIKKYFSNKFQTIHAEILKFKNNNKNYAELIYNKESEIIIDEILNLCFKMDLPVLTIHDALFTNEDYIDKLKEIVDNKLNKVTKNIKLTYKIK